MSMPSLELLRTAGVLSAADLHLGRWLLRGGAGPQAALAGALASRAVREGHVCVDLGAYTGAIVDAEGQPVPDVAWPDWAQVSSDPTVAREGEGAASAFPLVARGSWLYLVRYHDHEEALAARLLELARPAPVDEVSLEQGLSDLFDGSPESAGQQAACRTAVERRLAVVSGGPGTGKTHTVIRLVALLAQQRRRRGLSCRVRLLAPTGKAAARMLEALQEQAPELPEAYRAELPEQASTIQRALGSIGGARTRFRHGRSLPLPDDVVVVDEASMVDLALMRRLVEAVRPDAHLVLLGDRNQLASVESGAVLGEVVGAAQQPGSPIADSVALLTHSFRFDGAIGALAEAVRTGDVGAALAVLRAGGPVTWLDRPASRALQGPVGDTVAAGFRGLLRSDTPAEALDALGQFRVLCAHRRGPWGVETLNHTIEQRLAPLGLAPSSAWYARRPVMVTANDYRQQLFNGDQGVAMPGPSGLRVTMAGEGGRSLSPSRLADVETVFALSIHKSQGSEYEHVMVVLPEASSPLLSRELLYTAITRARSQLTIVGGEEELAAAIRRPLSRTSGLAQRLSGGHQGPAPAE